MLDVRYWMLGSQHLTSNIQHLVFWKIFFNTSIPILDVKCLVTLGIWIGNRLCIASIVVHSILKKSCCASLVACRYGIWLRLCRNVEVAASVGA